MADLPALDKDTAMSFAVLLRAGVPPGDAIRYFCDAETSSAELTLLLTKWLKHRYVQEALVIVDGKPWHEMNATEQIEKSLKKHYSEQAYYLFSHNFTDLNPSELTKANLARTTLEAKLAGNAGKVDAMTAFMGEMVEKLKSQREAAAKKEAETAAHLAGLPTKAFHITDS